MGKLSLMVLAIALACVLFPKEAGESLIPALIAAAGVGIATFVSAAVTDLVRRQRYGGWTIVVRRGKLVLGKTKASAALIEALRFDPLLARELLLEELSSLLKKCLREEEMSDFQRAFSELPFTFCTVTPEHPACIAAPGISFDSGLKILHVDLC